MTTAQEIHDALKQLGDNTDAVARRLQEAGIRGYTCKGNDCPIARFIKERFKPDYVEVRQNCVGCEFGRFDLPPAITQFIYYFDQGCYPELVQEKP
jgi:hypothetical protein